MEVFLAFSLKHNFVSEIEHWEDGQFFVQLCIETLYKRATLVAHLTNFSFNFFSLWFSDKMSPPPPSSSIPWCNMSKWPKTQIKGGGGGGQSKIFILAGRFVHTLSQEMPLQSQGAGIDRSTSVRLLWVESLCTAQARAPTICFCGFSQG